MADDLEAKYGVKIVSGPAPVAQTATKAPPMPVQKSPAVAQPQPTQAAPAVDLEAKYGVQKVEAAAPTNHTKAPPQQPPETFLHRTGREVVGALPAIGATAGGALGSATDIFTGPFGTLGGIGLGAGLGEAARQTVSHWFPDLAEAPSGTADALNKTVQQIGFGVASEVASPYINKAITKLAGPLVNSARKGLIKVMAPPDKIAKGYALEAANELLKKPGLGKDGYVSLTRKSLEAKAGSRAAATGAALEAKEAPVAGKFVLSALDKPRPMAAVDQKLADAHSDFMGTLEKLRSNEFMSANVVPNVDPAGMPGLIPPQEKLGAKPAIEAYDEVMRVIENEFGTVKDVAPPTLSPPGTPPVQEFTPGTGNLTRGSLRVIKQTIDKVVARSEGFARGTLRAAGAIEPALAAKLEMEKGMADRIRGFLNADEPDIAKLNAEFHLWRTMQKAMSPKTLADEFVKTPSPWTSFWRDRMVGLGLAAVAGVGHGVNAGNSVAGVASETAAAVGAVFAIQQAASTTAWRTASAAFKNELANKLAKGEFEGVTKALVRYVAQRDVSTEAPPNKKNPFPDNSETGTNPFPDDEGTK